MNQPELHIDMVCTNLNKDDIMTEVLTTGLSDHTGQLSTVNLEIHNTTLSSATRRHFTQDNLNNLKSTLRNETWQTVYDEPIFDQSYNCINSILNIALNLACPLKKSRGKYIKKVCQ